MTKITLLRHGQTDFNAQGRLQGRVDNPLNDIGIQQAKRAAEAIGPVDKIVSSPLQRAIQTAEVFNMDKVPDSGLAHMGNMRRLGIEKGKPFNPDERAKAILKRAAKTAEAIVLSMAFRNRQDGLIYDNRQYDNWAFVSDPTFYQEHVEEVEERAIGWHQLVGNFATYVPI